MENVRTTIDSLSTESEKSNSAMQHAGEENSSVLPEHSISNQGESKSTVNIDKGDQIKPKQLTEDEQEDSVLEGGWSDISSLREESAADHLQETECLTGKERNEAFVKAESYFSKSQLDQALQYYLQCIKGIERGSGFLYLPQCLHQIAECYHLKEEDDKAIPFLKAEKIYYETALIDTQQMEEKIEELAGSDDQRISGELESEILRAVEYENLAKLCLQKHQTQLALEFSGKATKLYQSHYGDDHKATQRCLDLFTTVYAEVGKEEYTSKLSEYESEPGIALEPASQEKNDTSLLRRRNRQSDKGSVTLTSAQPTTPPAAGEGEEEMSACKTAFLWILLVFCSVTAVILFSIVYCKLTPTSWTCHWCRVQYRYLSNSLGFMVYKINNS